MNNLNFMITQGSTPRIEMGLPFDFPESGGKAFATISQGGKAVLEYGLNGTPTATIAGSGTLTVSDDDASVLALRMTQTDTLTLTEGDAELQVRVKTSDGADTFLPIVGEVVAASKRGVIS